MTGDVLLQTEDVEKHFPLLKGALLRRPVAWIRAVDGVSVTIRRGQTLGLVGESGCGKTTLARLILLLEEATAGRISFRGCDVGQMSARERKEYRRSVQAVFQDPYSSLNPRMRIDDIVSEPIQINERVSKLERITRVCTLLKQVGLRGDSGRLYPHEFSGGQRQRIAVARALAINPSIIVLDEPVSALDVSVRAQIMNLLKDLQQEFGLTYLLIAHDLAVVKHMSTEIGVMYLGKLVEFGKSNELYARPLHPYTQALLSAALPAHPDASRRQVLVSGEVPTALRLPTGCRFHPRCPAAETICAEVEPPLTACGDGQQVACHQYSHTRPRDYPNR
ncbi:MAG: dipeptide ABC transporter ATP-binding protein [Chloroflexi bacterium]|nr:dipeptide ABC transporter ATP-binding protein [Chloroflexota bacterium]